VHLGISFDGTTTNVPAMGQRYAWERREIDLAAHEVIRASDVPLIGETSYRQMRVATERHSLRPRSLRRTLCRCSTNSRRPS
jgi:hypothetical protein